jgi:hypothetical protein
LTISIDRSRPVLAERPRPAIAGQIAVTQRFLSVRRASMSSGTFLKHGEQVIVLVLFIRLRVLLRDGEVALLRLERPLHLLITASVTTPVWDWILPCKAVMASFFVLSCSSVVQGLHLFLACFELGLGDDRLHVHEPDLRVGRERHRGGAGFRAVASAAPRRLLCWSRRCRFRRGALASQEA